MSKVTFLIGIPCSGKTTWARKTAINIVSKDEIRRGLYGDSFKLNKRSEEYVTEVFKNRIRNYIRKKHNFTVDDYNVKRKDISEVLELLPSDYTYEFKVFPISLICAYYRNIVNFLLFERFISFSEINKLQRYYNNLVI